MDDTHRPRARVRAGPGATGSAAKDPWAGRKEPEGPRKDEEPSL
ncbi:hypothetical protein [Streptomyces sp. NPDC086182]